MSEQQKPKPHGRIFLIGGRIIVSAESNSFTPDEAVALGYALFEHGLYLKGKMK